MAAADDLREAKASILARLKDMALSPKPTYSIDGQSVSRAEYQRMLTDQLKDINELLQVEEPYWYTSTPI